MDNIVIGIDAEIGPGLTRALDILEKVGAISKKDADAFRALNASGKEFAAGQNAVQKEVNETAKATENLGKKTQEASKATESFNNNKSSEGLKNLTKASHETRGEMERLEDRIRSVAERVIAVFAVERVVQFGNEAVEAFAKAEKSAIQLLGALNGNQPAQERLIKFAEEFSHRFAIPPSAINSQAAFLAVQGHTEDQIKKTIEAAIQLSAVTGEDLPAAVFKLSATYEGNIGRLGRMDKGFEHLSKTQLENGAAIDLVLEKYKGFAEKGLEGVSGNLQRTAVEIEEATIRFGKQIAPIKQFWENYKSVWLQGLGAFVEDAHNAIDKNKSFFLNPFGIFRKQTTDQEDADKLKAEFDKNVAFTVKSLQGANKLIVENVKKQNEDLLELNKNGFRHDSQLRQQYYKAQVEAAEQVLQKIQADEDAAAEKRIVTLRKLEDRLAELKNKQKDVRDPLTTGKAEADALIKEIADVQAQIDLINGKAAEEAKKKREQEQKELEQHLAELHKLEQDASDNLLKIKAEEVNKVIALEQQKQQAIRDLVESAGKASGAKVEPILIQFKQTGKVDLEKTLQLLKDAKFPDEEIKKFQQAVDDTTDSFTRLQNEIIQTQHLESLKQGFKDAFDFIEGQADKAALDIDSKFTNKKLDLIAEFKLSGQTPEDFARLQSALSNVDKQIRKELLDNEIATTEAEIKDAEHKNEEIQRIGEGQLIDTQKLNDKLTKLKNQANKDEVDDEQAKIDAEIKLEEEKLKKIQEVTSKIAELSHQFISTVGEAINNYYNAEADRITQNTKLTLQSYDERADALDKLHERNRIGDRQYEESKDQLAARRKAEEKKADKELKDLKKKQAEYNKALAIADAIINTAVAVTANLEVPFVAAAVAILGAAEVAVIASEPIPAYARGVEKVKGKGTETSDEVPARLSVGERVVSAPTNRKFFPILSAIHREKFDPESLNSISKFTKEELRILSKTDRTILKELATAQPVFLKHTTIPQMVTMRRDLVQQLTQKVEVKHTISKDPNALNEYDIQRAFTRAIENGIATKNPREIAKAIKEELKDPYASHRQ